MGKSAIFQLTVFFLKFDHTVPRLEVSSRSSGYHGLVDEDKQLVDVTPKIRASGAEVCAFRIVNKHHGETPFEVSTLAPAAVSMDSSEPADGRSGP